MDISNAEHILLTIGIVFGGTAVCLIVAVPWRKIAELPMVVMRAFWTQIPSPVDTITLIVQFVEQARRQGILVLERRLHEVETQFLREGIKFACDGVMPELINDIMQIRLVSVEERHKENQSILTFLGKTTLAMGLIAFLVNTVLAFLNSQETFVFDSGLLTLFIGPLLGTGLAFVIFFPLSCRLRLLSRSEVLCKQIMIEGIAGIQSGENPVILKQKLTAFLSYRHVRGDAKQSVEAPEPAPQSEPAERPHSGGSGTLTQKEIEDLVRGSVSQEETSNDSTTEGLPPGETHNLVRLKCMTGSFSGKASSFAFEDLMKLNDYGMECLLQKVYTNELSVALIGASQEIREKVFQNVSARRQKLIRAEIGSIAPLSQKRVHEAQQHIIGIIVEMRDGGEIIICDP